MVTYLGYRQATGNTKMPRLVITFEALQGLKRCNDFLKTKSPLAAQKAAKKISDKFSLLQDMPKIGRPFQDSLNLRELPIKFGIAGYLALYEFNEKEDQVLILAFKHQRELNYF